MLLFLIGILLTTALIFYAFPSETTNGSLVETFLTIAQILTLVLLVQNGTFIKTVFYKITLVGLGLLTIGSLFKIRHWPGAKELFITSFALILGSYGFHFIKKVSKKRLDWLKMIWVLVRIAGSFLTIFHLPYGREILYISQVIFSLTLVDFVYSGVKSHTLFKGN